MKIETERLQRCPNCSSSGSRHWCFASDLQLRTSEQQYEYRRCEQCDVVFLSTRPLEEALDLVYPDTYHAYGRRDSQNGWARQPSRESKSILFRIQGFLSQRATARFRDKLQSYYQDVRPGTVFLDFGCGAGLQLDKMRRAGCETIGMDFSTHALRQIERSGHRAVPVTPDGWNSIALGSVDFVRASHVLEHLYHVDKILIALHERLGPNGLIHLAVPNPSGLSATLFRRYWHGLECPRHAALYPLRALTELLVRLGFRVQEVLMEPLTKDHIRSWLYFLQGVGLLRFHSADDYIEWPSLRLLAAAPMLIAEMLGRSDRFHVFASKQP